MTILNVERIAAVGFRVRTKNDDEMQPSTAKIGALWNKFYAEAAPKLSAASKVYGVYTNYESDYTGLYDIVACSDTLMPEDLKDSSQVAIQPGKYLTFSAQGELPQIVVGLWTQVWEYFNSKDCQHSRAYTTDFEYYKSPNEVEISIAIQS